MKLTKVDNFTRIDNWKEYLIEKDNKEKEIIKRIKANTMTGRPLGIDTFVSKLEELLGRRLRALPHGRPRKEKT